jgi:hypothetical protein
MPGQFINSGNNPFGNLSLVNNSDNGNLNFGVAGGGAVYTYTLASLSSTNPSLACFNGFGYGTELVYASTNNGGAVTKFYTDSGLTTPFAGDTYAYLFQFNYPSGTNYSAYIDGSGNVSGNTAC